jgi:prepilin-type N-terminal cleavage/methylation domain-containing protein
MMTTNHTRRGYTLSEMVISMAIVLLVVSAATSGWLFVNRGERLNAVQSELDLDVRKTMELLKRDLRLSSMDKIFFYPTGPGPYSAIGFPLAKDNDGDGIIELGPGGSNILWDSTVIYHVQTTTPFRLLRTVFEPRDNNLTDAQRVEQIASVIANGNGKSTYNANNSTTATLFENLFEWSVEGKDASFDGYAPSLQRKTATFGSILLGPGSHNVKFTVTGKNPASTGYKIGVDTLTISPCGVEREAESQLPVLSQSGATAAWEYMSQGSWGANYQLAFPANSSGPSFTLSMENDRWEETNFRGMGSSCERTEVYWNESSSPKNFILKLEGYGYAWTATKQTQDEYYDNVNDNSLTNRTYRTLLRGRDMMNGAFLEFDGQNPYILFYSSSGGKLKIKNAYIGVAAGTTNYTPNAAGTMTRLKFGSDFDCELRTNDYAFATAASPFFIDKTKSYIVSYQIGSDDGNARAYTETHAGAPGSYYIDNPDAADVGTPDWSSKAVQIDSRVVGIEGVFTTYPTNGIFDSQIFDTKQAAPSYVAMTWNSEMPWSTAIGMKVRTGNQANLSDAPAWSNVVSMSTGGSISPASKRYVQFRATLTPSSGGWNTPVLKDVTIRWTGVTKVVDVTGEMTAGPNYGISSLTIDDRRLLKGIKINLTIFKDIAGWTPTQMRMTSSMSAEVEPRNTGK